MLAVAHQPLALPHHRPRLVRLIRIPPDLLHQLGRDGPLERPWLAVGIVMLLAASIALALWRGHRHRRAGTRPHHLGLRRMALGGWLTLLTLLGSAAGLNAYVGYVPTLPTLFGALPSHPTGSRFSRVETLLIGDRALDVPPARAYVYLPPGYDAKANAHRRYPVVYLLHGYPGSPIDWFRGAEVQDQMDALLRYQLVQPMLIVAPDASGGWLHDSEMLNQVGGPQVETYLTRTVVRAVDGRYRTVAGRAGRAIGGMSSGAYGVLNLGLRHPDLFSVILGEMPPATRGRSPGACSAAAGHCGWPTPRTRTSRGWPSTTRWRSTCSPAPATPAGPRPAGWWPCSRPAARRPSTRFTPGANHAWRGVRAELPDALAFASQHLHVPPVDRPVIEAVDRP
jgi:hypothetical protein